MYFSLSSLLFIQIALYGGELVPYYLDEDNGWSLDIDELKRSLNEAKSKGINCRALVFINPGNPTGQCLTESNIRDLITFCYDNRLILCADEVYQENIYDVSRPFISARKVLGTMPEPYKSGTEIVSFHTVSKVIPYDEKGPTAEWVLTTGRLWGVWATRRLHGAP